MREVVAVGRLFFLSFLPRDATQSAVLPRHWQVVRPSVCPSVDRGIMVILYSYRLEFLENNFTAD